MVIAPLIGPAMSASVGTVVDDDELFARGVRLQAVGVLLSVAGAAAFAFLVKTTHVVPPGLDVLSLTEVRERLRPDFLSLVVALGAGVAGVTSLMTGVSSALVGVAIAVALIPPAATVGIGLAWGIPTLAVGSAILVAVNVLSINLAALLVLWYSGYRPQKFFQVGEARAALVKRAATLAIAIAVLSAFLGGVTFASFEAAETEQAVDRAIDDVTAQAEYARVSRLDVEYQYESGLVTRQPQSVVVTLGVPPGNTYPDLAQQLATRIEVRSGQDLTVEVRYIEVERVESQRDDRPAAPA
jgi:uncharacterized hydrophobic protein (TIGR00271 family)